MIAVVSNSSAEKVLEFVREHSRDTFCFAQSNQKIVVSSDDDTDIMALALLFSLDWRAT